MSLSQYLARYAEPECALLTGLPGHWQQALVIPAYRETPGFLDQDWPENALVILVLNRPDSDPDPSWSLPFQARLGAAAWSEPPLSLHYIDGRKPLLLVDRCDGGPPLPAKQGVGLARKIGADLACALIARGQLHEPWIGCTDADAQWPTGYWQALCQQGVEAARVFPFSHRPEPGQAAWPLRCYELHMLYYVAGLRFAGSPYAWPTIGSCLAINAQHYARVRGYPKRAAGEDFYLLNKLAKVGAVRHCREPVITLSGRPSDRVPFGTGPALTKIASLASAADYGSYHPDAFLYLRALLVTLRDTSHDEAGTRMAVCELPDPRFFDELWQRFGCDAAITHARGNSRTEAQLQRQLMTWFDGFRSLKWLHACREQLPDQPLLHTLTHVNWITLHEKESAPLAHLVHQLQEMLADDTPRGP